MIRRAILIFLTVAAVATCAAWAASYHGFSISKTTYLSPDQHPLPARSVHGSFVLLFHGHLYVESFRTPPSDLPAALAHQYRLAFPPGWQLAVSVKPNKAMMERYYAKSWMPIISRPYSSTWKASTPLWLPTLLLIVYPATIFVRGPLRRWRRRRSGSCVQCGYTLRGLTEPRCPECSTEFDPSTLPSPPS